MDGKAFKTFEYERIIYLGDPVNIIQIYNDYDIEEMRIIDKSASQMGKINFNLMERIASEAFFPLTYQGGIKSTDDFARLNNLGFEKVGVNFRPQAERLMLIEGLYEKFSKSSVSLSVDLIEENFECLLYDWKTKLTLGNILNYHYLKTSDKFGELVLNFPKRDGLACGLSRNYEVIREFRRGSQLVIACGLANLDEVQNNELSSLVDGFGASRLYSIRDPLETPFIFYREVNNK